MARLTPEEQKTILTLHYEGKSIKDIMQATGRSREAIVRLFVACGIGEGSVQLNQRIWDRARIAYEETCRGQSGRTRFDNLPEEEKRSWYKAAREVYMKEAKTVIATIMGEDAEELKGSKKVDDEGEKTFNDIFRTFNRDQMNLVYKVMSEIADDQKIFDTFSEDQVNFLCGMIRKSHA